MTKNIDTAAHFADMARKSLPVGWQGDEWPEDTRFYLLTAAASLGYTIRVATVRSNAVFGKKTFECKTVFEVFKDELRIGTADTVEQAQENLCALAWQDTSLTL